MNKQEVFNTVYKHLLTQNRHSLLKGRCWSYSNDESSTMTNAISIIEAKIKHLQGLQEQAWNNPIEFTSVRNQIYVLMEVLDELKPKTACQYPLFIKNRNLSNIIEELKQVLISHPTARLELKGSEIWVTDQ